ncbi:twin-arginine translocation signal domain-containing protein [Streptomyces niveus]|uniref:twin-arginine translocation signal domain-containing protein n=1 Tax=Streptomyces niveus TaxID=193462 RepID=UPI0003C577FF|nr:twin-arginine translocation signal domain-containing protein [Streptomyces niveus]EST32979.1 hypothetical protein M877_02785 [Streptomyces niveus NCIMB 11891]
MSKISRRSLLGYSGTAAAGAVLASSATPASAATEEAGDAGAAAVEFQNGTEFAGSSRVITNEASLRVTFSIAIEEAPAANRISALEVAEALSALAEARGWSPITFYGTPPPAPLN